MWSIFKAELESIEKEMKNSRNRDIPSLFKNIPLELFGLLSLGVPDEFPGIKKWFPTMVSNEVQEHWTGNHGEILLGQTLEFVKTLHTGYAVLGGKKIADSKILDFGCGWGRIIRLLYKYTSVKNIFAVDPWDQSLNLCGEHKLKGSFAVSDPVLKSIPFQETFDLVFAYSVFTHLSEKTTAIALGTIRKYIADDGVLVITIRPKEFWHARDNIIIDDQSAEKMVENHEQHGFAFIPHDLVPIEGDITYGDTSISLEYIKSHFPDWAIKMIEWSAKDHLQVVVFLRPV